MRLQTRVVEEVSFTASITASVPSVAYTVDTTCLVLMGSGFQV